MAEGLGVRAARSSDAERLAQIFNQGVAERGATFETREQSTEAMARLISAARPLLVAERDAEVVAWARVGAYDDDHHYYDGIGEATLYVDRPARRTGIGRALLEALADEARRSGLHKLVGKIFTSNTASIQLVRECGWREVGIHRRHGELEGEWKDVLVVEKLLGEPAD
jgi:L-amino acid N-acyltransferase YncA